MVVYSSLSPGYWHALVFFFGAYFLFQGDPAIGADMVVSIWWLDAGVRKRASCIISPSCSCHSNFELVNLETLFATWSILCDSLFRAVVAVSLISKEHLSDVIDSKPFYLLLTLSLFSFQCLAVFRVTDLTIRCSLLSSQAIWELVVWYIRVYSGCYRCKPQGEFIRRCAYRDDQEDERKNLF